MKEVLICSISKSSLVTLIPLWPLPSRFSGLGESFNVTFFVSLWINDTGQPLSLGFLHFIRICYSSAPWLVLSYGWQGLSLVSLA